MRVRERDIFRRKGVVGSKLKPEIFTQKACFSIAGRRGRGAVSCSPSSGNRVPAMYHVDAAAADGGGGGEDDDFVIDDLDAIAAAAAELDGNRPRRPNPLTIIQVKNPAKNVDGGGGGGHGGPLGALRWTRPRQLCVTAVAGLALLGWPAGP